jgi:hypothetical protein
VNNHLSPASSTKLRSEEARKRPRGQRGTTCVSRAGMAWHGMAWHGKACVPRLRPDCAYPQTRNMPTEVRRRAAVWLSACMGKAWISRHGRVWCGDLRTSPAGCRPNQRRGMCLGLDCVPAPTYSPGEIWKPGGASSGQEAWGHRKRGRQIGVDCRSTQVGQMVAPCSMSQAPRSSARGRPYLGQSRRSALSFVC